MRLETPDAGRAQFSKNADSIQIVLPSRKNLAAVVFLGFWLCGWALGELFAIGRLASLISGGIEQADSSELFIFVWLCGWTIGGAFAISSFLWSLFGRECLTVGQGVLTIERSIPLWARRRYFDIHEIDKFRVAPQKRALSSEGGNIQVASFFSNFRHGTIQFDYGRGMRAFGLDLDEAEAKDIIGVITNYISK